MIPLGEFCSHLFRILLYLDEPDYPSSPVSCFLPFPALRAGRTSGRMILYRITGSESDNARSRAST